MEKKHIHLQHSRLANSGYLTNCRESDGRFHLGVILLLGLLSIGLLIGLLVANTQYSDSKCTSIEELNNLTDSLRSCNEMLFNIREGAQLPTDLPEEANGFQSLSEQNGSECNWNENNELSTLSANLTACLTESDEKLTFISKERDLLNTKLGKTTEELLTLCHLFKNTTCPDGWTKFNCSCYRSFGPGSWDEGREDCVTKGGDLVVIDDPEEQNFLSNFTEEAWIGLSVRETEESWLWVDGTSLSFTFWKNNQTDKDGDCATYDSRLWDTLSCTATKHWICEKIPTTFAPNVC